MKDIFEKTDKNLLSTYPTIAFAGDIYEISTEADATKALYFLERQSILGLDTETRPVFTRGQTRRVSLLQLSTHEECFLFHLNRLGITPQLKALFENGQIKKIGLSLHDDILALKRRTPFEPSGFIDLQSLVPLLGIQDQSLQKLFANFFHQRISKREQLSNWERIPLNEKQRRYAATDAWACLQLYEEIQHLLATKDFNLIPASVDDNAQTNS